MHVVRRELEMPAHLSGIDVDREERARVEVVALACVAVPVGTGIAGAPVEQLQRGVVRAGQPRRARTAHPAVTGPSVAARFAWRWYGLETPDRLPVLRIVRVEVAADAGLAAADTDDDLVVGDERRRRNRVATRVVANRYSPSL